MGSTVASISQSRIAQFANNLLISLSFRRFLFNYVFASEQKSCNYTHSYSTIESIEIYVFDMRAASNSKLGPNLYGYAE